MEKQVPISRVLLVQSVGFLSIIALSWFDEFVDLRSLVLGDHPYISRFRQSVLETLLVLAVWFLVGRATRRAVGRADYLEGFARVCAWCHKICFKDTWVHLDEYLEREFDTPTTHGICPSCVQAHKAALEKARTATNDGRTAAANPGQAPPFRDSH